MKKICFATAAALLLATSAFAQNVPENNPGASPGKRTITHTRRDANVTRTEPNRAPGVTTGTARSRLPMVTSPDMHPAPNTTEGLTSGAGGSGGM